MANVFQNAASWLAGQLKQHAGRTVTLKRNGIESESITGWVSQKQYRTFGPDGSQSLETSFEWSFQADDLIWSGEQVVPRCGDVIAETLNGTRIEYEVLPDVDRPETQWSDDAGVIVIARTRKLA